MANNTKWGEFFTEVKSSGIPLEIKLIDDEDTVLCGRIWCPVPNILEGDLMGPYPFYWVEWVRSDQVDKVSELARTVGLECFIEGSKATVYGYR